MTLSFNGKSSFMEHDIGPHDIVIQDTYEVYAVCTLCGFHDWSIDNIEGLLAKYPKATVYQPTYEEEEL